jgi:SpoVK/Ycf46/Vps4 family AAA+-type ATPase
VKLGEGFNGADMRNICTEAGLFAIRAERDYVVQEDFMKVRGEAGPTGGAVTHGAGSHAVQLQLQLQGQRERQAQ